MFRPLESRTQTEQFQEEWPNMKRLKYWRGTWRRIDGLLISAQVGELTVTYSSRYIKETRRNSCFFFQPASHKLKQNNICHELFTRAEAKKTKSLFLGHISRHCCNNVLSFMLKCKYYRIIFPDKSLYMVYEPVSEVEYRFSFLLQSICFALFQSRHTLIIWAENLVQNKSGNSWTTETMVKNTKLKLYRHMWPTTRKLSCRYKKHAYKLITRELILNKQKGFVNQQWYKFHSWNALKKPSRRTDATFQRWRGPRELRELKAFLAECFNLFMLKCRCGEALPALHRNSGTWRFPIWLFH